MSDLTVSKLSGKCEKMGRKPPSGTRKEQLVELYEGLLKAKEMGITVKNYKVPSNNTPYKTVWCDYTMDYKEHFRKYGWCSIPVEGLNPEELSSEFLKWIKHNNKDFNPEDSTTWKNIPSNTKGIFKIGIGHEEFVWKAREATYPYWCDLWDDDDLVCSFDGACFRTCSEEKYWLHCDSHQKYNTIQGFYNLERCGKKDGGLLLLHDSRKVFRRYVKRHPYDYVTGFTKTDLDDPDLKKCKPIKICCNSGDLVVWDGRMVHCNVPCKEEGRRRMCIYISMQQKSLLSEKENLMRIKWSEDRVMTCHWCYGPLLRRAQHNWRDKNIPVSREDMTENELRRKLVGYRDL